MSFDYDRPTLKVNAFGLAKAEKFRAHFNLSKDGFADDEWLDAHDYLHTTVGARPENAEEELRVLYLYEEIIAGVTAKPRGLL